jgi:hypothetical protein
MRDWLALPTLLWVQQARTRYVLKVCDTVAPILEKEVCSASGMHLYLLSTENKSVIGYEILFSPRYLSWTSSTVLFVTYGGDVSKKMTVLYNDSYVRVLSRLTEFLCTVRKRDAERLT